jgi:peptidoglycan/xylan/chitin deacetylase (PgdA/CDA1 family)
MFWPNDARIAVTTSLMFEAGSQDHQKTFGPFPVAQEGNFPDLPTNSWFDYAANEGIPRALELFDRHGVKASSFMTCRRDLRRTLYGSSQRSAQLAECL